MDPLVSAARSLPDGTAPPSAPNLGAVMTRRTGERGHSPFLTYYDSTTGERTELSYATFDNWASKTADLIVEELELGRGDRVATLLGNHWTAPVVAFACWKAGCCLVPLDAAGAAAATSRALDACGARAAFVREDLLGHVTAEGATSVERVVAVGLGLGARRTGQDDQPGDVLGYGEEVPAFADEYDDPDVTLDDDALLALPPAAAAALPAAPAAPAPVRLTQGNLLAAGQAVGAWGVGHEDRLLCAQGVHLTDGLALTVLGAFVAGASVVLTRDFDADRLWRRVADERVTLLGLSPAQLDLLPDGSPPDCLGCAMVPAGAARDVVAHVRSRIPVAVGHGLVEATCSSTLSPREPDPPTAAWLEAAAGRPVGAVTAQAVVAALDHDGAPLGHGAEGCLAVRGPLVMAGYDGRAELDGQVFASGWFSSADRGFTDVGPDGATHVFSTGRA